MNDPFETGLEFIAMIHAMGWLAIVLIVFFVTIGGWLFSSLALMLGAKIANIDDRSFGKAFLTVVLGAILGSIIISILSFIHPLLSLLGLLIPIIFIQWIYSCTFGKAFVAYITSVIAHFVIYFGLALAFIFGASALMQRMPKTEGTTQNKEEQVDNSSEDEPILDEAPEDNEEINTGE